MGSVLIVEDNRVSAKILAGILERNGHHPLMAADGTEAWRLLDQTVVVDLVFLDNHLTKEYGWEFLGRLRKSFLFEAIPVVVYTASGDRESVLRYIEQGVQNILTKPYKPTAITEEVEKALRTPWRDRFFEPVNHVCARLDLKEEDYYRHLNSVADELHACARNLKNLLGAPNDVKAFNQLEALRSNAATLGLASVKRAYDLIMREFNSDDLSRTLNAINVLPQIARLLETRFRVYFGLDDGAVKAASPSQPARSAEEKNQRREQEQFWEVPLSRSAADASFLLFAPDLEGLLRTPLLEEGALWKDLQNGHCPKIISDFGRSLSVLTESAHVPLEELTARVDAVPGLSAKLDALLRREEPQTPSPLNTSGCIKLLGHSRTLAILLVMEWLEVGRQHKNPLDLRLFAAQRLLVALLARLLGRRMESLKDLEMLALMDGFGHWIMALRHPALYGLYLRLQESSGQTVRGALERNVFGTRASELGGAFLRHWNVPDPYPLLAEATDLRAMKPGLSRRSAAFLALARSFAAALMADRKATDTARQAFIAHEAWEVLAKESIVMPVTPEELLKHLWPTGEQVKESVAVLLRDH